MHSLKVYFKPDNYPDWVFWKRYDQVFNMIGEPGALDIGGVPSIRPGFAPRVSFGKPSDACDPLSTNRRLRRGYQFQVRFVGTGHVTIERFRMHGQVLIENARAQC
jgi:hypothetical protein